MGWAGFWIGMGLFWGLMCVGAGLELIAKAM